MSSNAMWEIGMVTGDGARHVIARSKGGRMYAACNRSLLVVVDTGAGAPTCRRCLPRWKDGGQSDR